MSERTSVDWEAAYRELRRAAVRLSVAVGHYAPGARDGWSEVRKANDALTDVLLPDDAVVTFPERAQ